MEKRIRKIRKMRLHHEGNHTLIGMLIFFLVLNYLVFCLVGKWVVPLIVVCITLYLILVNFFRCPIRKYEENTEGIVIAPCDGKVVVIEEVDENEYFKDRRLMVSIFMSIVNVHANWVPCDGKVKYCEHHDGRFQAAWLPKASTENERSTIVIETPDNKDIMMRQVAGALARRICTYPSVGEEVEIDQHIGFIKFGSRCDIYLPVGTKVDVVLGQKTYGNETIIAHI